MLRLPRIPFRTALLLGTVLRFGLLVYGEYHDSRSAPGLKYTDVDYRVFSDAATFLLNPGEGNNAQGVVGKWMGIGEYVPFVA